MLGRVLKGGWAFCRFVPQRGQRMTVRQDRQTRRPPLAGGWSVRGAKGSVARMRHCACSGDDA